MSKILINRANLYHNLDLIKKRLGSINKIACVLKDNAYGHGIKEMSYLLKTYGVKTAIVRDMKEALEIKDDFQSIIVLSEINSIEAIDNISFTINSLKDFERIKEGSNIELKVDSGMHRNGITIDELEVAFEKIKQKRLNLNGILTHLRASDELSSELFWQRKNFESIRFKAETLMKRYFISDVKFHSLNSAGVFRLNEFSNDDLARVGIAMYGYLENEYLFSDMDLKPVLSLWADKVASRVIKIGQRVGYGGTFEAQRDMIISTYDIGYSDFIRFNENMDYTLPSKNKILGRVSMDSMSIDSHEQSICIFDNAQDVAKHFNTISYEILVKLSHKVKRIIV